jgi:hypothetical protein
MILSPIDLRHRSFVLNDLQRGVVHIPTALRSGPDVVRNAVRIATRFREAQAK